MRWLAILVCATACRGSTPQAPDPVACTTAADCAAAPLFDPDQPCCSTGIALTVRSKAWLDWYALFQAQQCGAVKCPVMPPPTPPLPCALQPRCERHRCIDSCAAAGSGSGK